MSNNNSREDNDFVQVIAEKLKSILAEKNISISKMAIDTDVSRTSLHAILNGKGNPKIRLLVIIIEYLGMQPKDFFKQL
jgi:DNA-binding phage protein